MSGSSRPRAPKSSLSGLEEEFLPPEATLSRTLQGWWSGLAPGPVPCRRLVGAFSPGTDGSPCFSLGRIDKTMLASLKVK